MIQESLKGIRVMNNWKANVVGRMIIQFSDDVYMTGSVPLLYNPPLASPMNHPESALAYSEPLMQSNSRLCSQKSNFLDDF